VITAATLKNRTVKDLAAMARKKKVLGWHTMRKDELVQALLKVARMQVAKRHAAGNNGAAKCRTKEVRLQAACNGNGNGNGASHAQRETKKPRAQDLEHRLQQIKAKVAEAKDLSFKPVAQNNGHTRDRLVVMVRDPYWLHAYWELNRRSIERARVAMGQHWHGARPVLRLHEVSRNGTTSAARQAVRDIEIHGGVNNWYIDVHDPPKSYELEVGYREGSHFYCLARSNVVSTPPAGGGDAFDKNWADVAKDFDRIYAMSAGYAEQEGGGDLKEVLEEQLHRPIGNPLATQFGLRAGLGGPKREFPFHIDTELIVHGVAHPDARVTLRGEPVRLRPDGTFAVRFSLPDRRHVLPVVARSSDGTEQRTIVLAVDRNTKVMEPVIRDPGD
jgi:uncharacterized protein